MENEKFRGSVGIYIEGGSDISIVNNRMSGHDLGIVATNVQRLHAEGNTIKLSLRGAVPSLPDLSGEQFSSLVELAKNDSDEDLEERIRHSPVGRWLSEQSFVEWASLAAAILGLLK